MMVDCEDGLGDNSDQQAEGTDKTLSSTYLRCLPNDIWVQILSRLSIKSLLVCRSVCKNWRDVVSLLRRKSIPLCGLLIMPYSSGERPQMCMSYTCVRTKETIVKFGSEKLIASSGYDKGLLSELLFHFGKPFYRVNGFKYGYLYVVHRGLLLVSFNDGTYEVHNPTNKEIFRIPKSPIVMENGLRVLSCDSGAVIQLPSLPGSSCHFMVVRLCLPYMQLEMYHSRTARWTAKCIRSSYVYGATFHMNNYVALCEGLNGIVYLFFLTDKGHGVAIKFTGRNKENITLYAFPLPEFVRGKFNNTRLWEWDGSLAISCYDASGMWVWKQHDYGSTDADAWAWVPQLEIMATLLSKQLVAQKHLAQALDVGDRIMLLACHPDVAVVFLLVKSMIFSYNLTNNTIEKVAEINEHNFEGWVAVFPFKPCLSSLDAAKRAN